MRKRTAGLFIAALLTGAAAAPVLSVPAQAGQTWMTQTVYGEENEETVETEETGETEEAREAEGIGTRELASLMEYPEVQELVKELIVRSARLAYTDRALAESVLEAVGVDEEYNRLLTDLLEEEDVGRVIEQILSSLNLTEN